MSDQLAATAPPPPPTTVIVAQPPSRASTSWKVGSIAGVLMVLLALLGVGLTTSRNEFSLKYWIALVPIFGLLCIGTAYARARRDSGLRVSTILLQVFHWLGIAAALGLDFVIRGTGEETSTAAGLNALLLLALGCYLAGIHLERLFVLVGVLLSLALIVVAKAEQYVWLVFVLGGIAIAAIIGGRWLYEKSFRKKAPSAPA